MQILVPDDSVIDATLQNGEAERNSVEDIDDKLSRGQGFLKDAELRLRLELFAMETAKTYFASLGFVCEDHS